MPCPCFFFAAYIACDMWCAYCSNLCVGQGHVWQQICARSVHRMFFGRQLLMNVMNVIDALGGYVLTIWVEDYSAVRVPLFDLGPLLREVMSNEPDGIEDSEHPGQESDPNPENTDSNAAIQPFLNPHVDVPVLCPSTLATATVPTQTSTGVAESGAEVAHVQRSRNSGSHRRRKNNRPEQRAAAKNANGSDHAALPEKIVK